MSKLSDLYRRLSELTDIQKNIPAEAADKYHQLQQSAAKDLEKTVEPGTASGLMLARLKALNPLVSGEDINFLEQLPGTRRGALALEDAMQATPYGLAGRPDIGAAVAQFLPQVGAELVGQTVGGGLARLAGKGVNAYDHAKAVRKVQQSAKGLLSPAEEAQKAGEMEAQVTRLLEKYRANRPVTAATTPGRVGPRTQSVSGSASKLTPDIEISGLNKMSEADQAAAFKRMEDYIARQRLKKQLDPTLVRPKPTDD